MFWFKQREGFDKNLILFKQPQIFRLKIFKKPYLLGFMDHPNASNQLVIRYFLKKELITMLNAENLI